MRLLVTNDDGIGCVFLHELVRALIAADHQVFVVAPKIEQSWTGASKSRHRPVRSESADLGLRCPTWIVDGTPSDCVNIGIDHLLPEPPEAVLSGINVGLNASLGQVDAMNKAGQQTYDTVTGVLTGGAPNVNSIVPNVNTAGPGGAGA